MSNKYILELKEFLDESPTAYQASGNIIYELEQNGFKELDETEEWKLKPGGKYYVCRNQSAVIAFINSKALPTLNGFKLIGAHTDSPSLKIKPLTEKCIKGNRKLGVEIYGGPIISTWLDRELSIAGRVVIKDDKNFESRTIDIRKAVGIIPNAAIHLNREVNSGFQYNAQHHLPIMLGTGGVDDEAYLKKLVAEHLDIEPQDVLEYDLFLYDPQPATLIGTEKDGYIISGRQDDLAMCHAILKALVESKAADTVLVGIFFDNEEVGSRTLQGAGSPFLASILKRISLTHNLSEEGYHIALRKSKLISADLAHAFHPNFSEKHDPDYAPVMNGGPVIKVNAGFSYATTAETSWYFEELCKKAGVPVQKIIGRSDARSGSTIGPISSAQLGIDTVDVGNPIWSMHSIRETSGQSDHGHMINVMKEFYKKG
jgi:aspartyl aminopeptidase